MEADLLEDLKRKANHIRRQTILAIGRLGVGHIGGCMSIVEILVLLYYRHMHIDPKNPKMPDRDRLVLSKGHGGPTLYSILADRGFFPETWLDTLNVGGTSLPSHCDMNRTPGIDMTTGSLGQGLSAAVGMALANRLDGIDRKVYALLGDGDNNEGQTWEAAMTAVQYSLSNLIAFTDYNKMQIDGNIADIMNTEDLCEKWRSFGWRVFRVDGHDLQQLDEAVAGARSEKSRPSMIICDTVKGKGAFFCEGQVGSHNMAFDLETAREAVRRLKEAD
ncbi:MAG: transketolase [Spirochaetales bacterium]|nr:transketolase [Spirochaetales bacterium]